MLSTPTLKKSLLFALICIEPWALPAPVHAYAGPGVAIGSLVVAVTVVLAFALSIALRIRSVFKSLQRKFRRRQSRVDNAKRSGAK